MSYTPNDVSISDWLSRQVGSVVNGYRPIGYVARGADWLSSLGYMVKTGCCSELACLIDVNYVYELVLTVQNCEITYWNFEMF